MVLSTAPSLLYTLGAMSNAAVNHHGKGSTLATRRPKAKDRKRKNKEKARVRREARRATQA